MQGELVRQHSTDAEAIFVNLPLPRNTDNDVDFLAICDLSTEVRIGSPFFFLFALRLGALREACWAPVCELGSWVKRPCRSVPWWGASPPQQPRSPFLLASPFPPSPLRGRRAIFRRS